jgi:hypothetical protein
MIRVLRIIDIVRFSNFAIWSKIEYRVVEEIEHVNRRANLDSFPERERARRAKVDAVRAWPSAIVARQVSARAYGGQSE